MELLHRRVRRNRYRQLPSLRFLQVPSLSGQSQPAKTLAVASTRAQVGGLRGLTPLDLYRTPLVQSLRPSKTLAPATRGQVARLQD